jgi:hypothetical protein
VADTFDEIFERAKCSFAYWHERILLCANDSQRLSLAHEIASIVKRLPENQVSNTVTVTIGLIEKGKSLRGGWSRRQIELLGITYPPTHGWAKRSVGNKITASEAEEFLALKDAHVPARLRATPPSIWNPESEAGAPRVKAP